MEPISFNCEDGTTLRGHFWAASPAALAPPVLLSPATGVKQHFYFRFAQWLSEQGHDVMVFDYRGIGLSLQGPLQACKANLAEWGQQDQVAALEWLCQRTGHAQVLLMGHSAGGQMIGLLPNHRRVAKVVGISASTGWMRGMPWRFRQIARLGLLGILPLGWWLKGYAPASWIGLGENLPKRVAQQWGQWCARGGYATNAVKHTPHLDFHAEVRIPFTVLHASDDNITTEATVADLLRTLPHAQHAVQCVQPAPHGLKSIGHIDWFRSSHQVLWPLMAQALKVS